MKLLKTRKKRRVGRGILLVLAVLLLALAIGTWLYVRDYYHADDRALAALAPASQDVTVKAGDDRIDFVPRAPIAGLIFYPGAKVEFTAYAPLMEACAERGVLCVLLKMPGNLAVLDYNAADGIPEDYPEVTRWYVGGHSLGGNIAATYAKKHADAVTGLVMLAAYSTDDLTDTDLQVLSVYGANDGVLNRERYETYRENLPADTTEIIIEGGCHSFFGSYGIQAGDGAPAIPLEAQIAQTADAIAALAADETAAAA